jgi:hypothetical protein
MSIVAEDVTIDPVTEDPSLVPLDLVGTNPSWGIYLLGHEYPPPELTTQTAGGADTEGDPVVQSKYGNRTITVRVRVFEPSDPAATNLIPNPSGELNATGWSTSSAGYAGVTLTREALPSLMSTQGSDFGLRMKGTHEASVTERFLVAETKSGVEGIPVVVGTTYTFSFYGYFPDPPVRTGGNTKSLWVSILWYTAAGAEISQPIKEYAVAAGDFSRYSVTAEAPATAAFAKVRVSCDSNVSGDTIDMWIDRTQFEAAAAPTAYLDGDTPGCDWSGARHATASTRPAPDGTRFSRIYRDLTRKLDRIKRQKSGTLRRIAPGFKTGVYDLRSAKVIDAPQGIDIGMKRAEVGLSFEADPGCRTAEVQIGGTREELVLPALSFLAEEVPGELEALGRLVVEEKQAQAQGACYWGLQFDTYSSSVDAELFYEAESRTPLGTAALESRAGASGGGNNTIKHANLVAAYQGIMSTQKAAAGNHLAHFGSYRVLARMQRPTTNTGQVAVKFVWTDGDFVKTTENEEVIFPEEDHQGMWQLVDLGMIDIDKVPSGSTQRWEGRVLAKSTVAGDDIYIDFLMLVPAERSGKTVASSEPAPVTSLGALDLFNQGAGALTGKSAEIGGAYTGAGDVDDFTVTGAGQAQRVAVSDAAGIGRYCFLATTSYTDVAVKLRIGLGLESGFAARAGFVVRYIDVNNWVAFAPYYQTIVPPGGIPWKLKLEQKVAGVRSTLAKIAFTPGSAAAIDLQLIALSTGDWRIGAEGLWIASGNAAALGAAGALKEGKVGLWDEKTAANAETRTFDNFEAWVPSIDRALYPSRTLELRSDRIRRQDVAGTTWGKPPYQGDYLLIPPAGPEKASSRFIVKDSRDPEADEGIDDTAAKLFATPRYLIQPPA